ncbi:MAG: MarR family transcriptional regulator [Sarcina sp.]
MFRIGILNSIYASPNITLNGLVDKISIPKSTLSIALDELVNNNLVEYINDSNDRRKINLKYTQSRHKNVVI